MNGARRQFRSHTPPFLERLRDAQPNGQVHYRFWQRGDGYDRNIQESATLNTMIDYIHNRASESLSPNISSSPESNDSDDAEEFYPHYRDVEWIKTEYMPRASLVSEGEPRCQNQFFLAYDFPISFPRARTRGKDTRWLPQLSPD